MKVLRDSLSPLLLRNILLFWREGRSIPWSSEACLPCWNTSFLYVSRKFVFWLQGKWKEGIWGGKSEESVLSWVRSVVTEQNPETGEGKKFWAGHTGSFESNISVSLVISHWSETSPCQCSGRERLGEGSEGPGLVGRSGAGQWCGAILRVLSPCLLSSPASWWPAGEWAWALHWGRNFGSLLPTKHVRGSVAGVVGGVSWSWSGTLLPTVYWPPHLLTMPRCVPGFPGFPEEGTELWEGRVVSAPLVSGALSQGPVRLRP